MSKILIVEDDKDTAERMLKELGILLSENTLQHTVEWVTTHSGAVACLSSGRYDLVSTDGSYPITQGTEPSSVAGISLINILEKLQHTGHVIFYSSRERDVEAVLNGRTVSEKPVHARVKAISDDKELNMATISSWAELCISLLKS